MILLGTHLTGFTELEKLQKDDPLVRNRYNEVKTRLTEIFKGPTREFIARTEDFIYYSFLTIKEALDLAVDLQREFEVLNSGTKEERKVPLSVAVHEVLGVDPSESNDPRNIAAMNFMRKAMMSQEPGEILLSDPIKLSVEDKIDCTMRVLVQDEETEETLQFYSIDWQNGPLPASFLPEDEESVLEEPVTDETQIISPIDQDMDETQHLGIPDVQHADFEGIYGEESSDDLPAAQEGTGDVEFDEILDTIDDTASFISESEQAKHDEIAEEKESPISLKEETTVSEEPVAGDLSIRLTVPDGGEEDRQEEDREIDRILEEIDEEQPLRFEPDEIEPLTYAHDDGLDDLDVSTAGGRKNRSGRLVMGLFIIAAISLLSYRVYDKGVSGITDWIPFLRETGPGDSATKQDSPSYVSSADVKAPTRAPRPQGKKPGREQDLSASRSAQTTENRETEERSPGREKPPGASASDSRRTSPKQPPDTEPRSSRQPPKDYRETKADDLLSTKTMITDARNAIESGNWNAAYNKLMVLNKKNPGDPVLNYMMGSVALKLGAPSSRTGKSNMERLDQAQIHFRRVLDARMKRETGGSPEITGFGELEDEFKKIKTVELIKILAKINMWRTDYVNAFDLYQRVLEENIGDTQALQNVSAMSKKISPNLRNTLTRKYMNLFEKNAQYYSKSQKDALGIIIYSLMEAGE